MGRSGRSWVGGCRKVPPLTRARLQGGGNDADTLCMDAETTHRQLVKPLLVGAVLSLVMIAGLGIGTITASAAEDNGPRLGSGGVCWEKLADGSEVECTTAMPSPSASPSLSTSPTPTPMSSSSPAPTASAPPPTATPTASQTPSPTQDEPAGPPVTYWPDSDSTGVPSSTSLTVVAGWVSATVPGQVLEGLDIRGCVRVKASNVIIRRSRVTCDGTDYAIGQVNGATGLLVEDVEIDGGGLTVASICCGDYTARRVNTYNSEDGPRVGSRTTIEDSYIHHLKRRVDSHNDALQTTGGSDIIIRHNNLQAYNPTTNDPFNAAIMLGSTTAPSLSRVLIEDNLLNGGNYTVNFRADTVADNVVVRSNYFQRDYRYGPVLRPDVAGVTWATSNIWLDSRLSVR